MNFGSENEERMVDALEEGRIVRVSESYAKQEGLTVLRRHEAKNYADRGKAEVPGAQRATKEIGGRSYKKGILSFDDLRKPLDWRKNQIVSELVEDFHWVITNARRQKNMTRKQFANALHENEEDIKKLENGIIPTDDFVLINKVQDYLNINLRKDGMDFRSSARASLNFEKIARAKPAEDAAKAAKAPEAPNEVEIDMNETKMIGDDIEIVDAEKKEDNKENN